MSLSKRTNFMGIRNKCFYGWGYKQGEVGYTPSLPLNKKWMGGMPMRARSRCKAHTREDCVGVCVRVCECAYSPPAIVSHNIRYITTWMLNKIFMYSDEVMLISV